jgi:peroxiredoxin Q/BCP
MKTILAAAALLAPLLVLQDGPEERPADAGALVGAAAPAFRHNDQDGEIQEVGGEHAQWTVLAFYPKALTGG